MRTRARAVRELSVERSSYDSELIDVNEVGIMMRTALQSMAGRGYKGVAVGEPAGSKVCDDDEPEGDVLRT
jgi:hypothetical protein